MQGFIRLIRCAYADERGNITLWMYVSASMVLLVMLGFVVDAGNLLVEKAKLQNAVDAAAAAGLREFVVVMHEHTVLHMDTVWVSAEPRVLNNIAVFAQLNGVSTSELTIDVSQVSSQGIIIISASRHVPLSFASFLAVDGFVIRATTSSYLSMR